MEHVCFLCQEYETDIGHQTILCPKQFCKKCLQSGHFAMNCKDFVTKDEQMVKLENEDETKTEIHFDDHPCKVETKMENYITVKKDLVKTENRSCGEFSKSEEDSLMYCLESMPPTGTKKRKFDSESPIEKDLPLDKVQQKIIEKLSNDLVNLTESKRKMEAKYESRITDLKERLSKNLLIIETLRACKKELEAELSDAHESTVSKSLVLKNSQLKQYQSKIIEQNKDLKFFHEVKEKKQLEMNCKLQEKEREIHLFQAHFNLETLKLNDVITKLKNEIHTLWESKEKLELEWNNELHNTKFEWSKELAEKESEMQLLQAKFTEETFKLKDIIGKQRKLTDAFLWNSKDKILQELNIKLQSKETEIRKYKNQAEVALALKASTSDVQNRIIAKLNKDLEILRESKEKMELELNSKLQGKETEIKKFQNQAEVALEMKAWASGVQKRLLGSKANH